MFENEYEHVLVTYLTVTDVEWSQFTDCQD